MYTQGSGPVAFKLIEMARLACGSTSIKLPPAGQALLAEIIAEARAGKLQLYGQCLSDYSGNRITHETAVRWFQARGWTLPAVLVRRRTLEEAEARIEELEIQIRFEFENQLKPEPGRELGPIVSERLYRPFMLLLATLVKLVAHYHKERRTKDGAPIVNAIADDVLVLVGDERGLSSASIRNHISEALRLFDRDIGAQASKKASAARATVSKEL